ncbi:MAG: hypothetical protein KIT72_03450 [Polyangiaceae bacterium]|nr:hypothetical protein [Polyangiaceae bacterium]MCW5789456.1 hypothetical protein [Polyangiaceae bacterium]
MRWTPALCLLLAPLGCDDAPVPKPDLATLPSALPTEPKLEAPEPPPVLGPAETVPAGAKACGVARCLEFPAPVDAFRHVLSRKPRVLAVGEAHALKGTEDVRSSTARFTTELLPELRGQASDLILELWFPNPSCKKETIKKVEAQQAVVTERQATSNQNEFVELGNVAKRLGIQPKALEPSCEDLQKITEVGTADIALMLETVAKYTALDARARLAKQKEPKVIVLYGGAMHNDLHPRPGAEAWTFGPELSRESEYLALDLIVPEYIKDTDAWRMMPWYEAYTERTAKADSKPSTATLLYEPRARELVLIFPRSSASRPAGEGR